MVFFDREPSVIAVCKGEMSVGATDPNKERLRREMRRRKVHWTIISFVVVKERVPIFSFLNMKRRLLGEGGKSVQKDFI